MGDAAAFFARVCVALMDERFCLSPRSNIVLESSSLLCVLYLLAGADGGGGRRAQTFFTQFSVGATTVTEGFVCECVSGCVSGGLKTKAHIIHQTHELRVRFT